jgi:hypothetical protein
MARFKSVGRKAHLPFDIVSPRKSPQSGRLKLKLDRGMLRVRNCPTKLCKKQILTAAFDRAVLPFP